MKVLIISHTYIAQINRDKWKVLSQKHPTITLKVIIPTIWPTHLFTHRTKDLIPENTNNCEFIALNANNTGNEILYRYNFKELYTLIKIFKPDILHVEQGDNALCYAQAIACIKLLRLKTKCLFFTWVNWKPKHSLKYKLIWGLIEKFNRKFSVGAFVGNHDAQILLQEKKFTKPIKILPQLGVNNHIFIPAQKSPTKKIISFIGRLVPEKGVLMLLDVFTELHKEFPEWELLYVGDGPCKQELQTYIIKHNLIHHVYITPPVAHPDVSLILQKTSILVLPSYDTHDWREQFGHVLIEAMACKIPVIGSNAGEIPNVIGDTGIIFEQKNKQSLLACLKTLMQNQDMRKRLGEKGYERVLFRYTHDAIADATVAFWQHILH